VFESPPDLGLDRYVKDLLVRFTTDECERRTYFFECNGLAAKSFERVLVGFDKAKGRKNGPTVAATDSSDSQDLVEDLL